MKFAAFCVALALCAQSISGIPVPGEEPYLLFSSWLTVSRMNTDGSNYAVLANAAIQDVDYHYSQNKVFWNDVSEGTIYQADLDSGDNAVAIVSGFNRPSGLAVDWINNKLYFSFNDPHSLLDYPNHLAYYDLTTGAIEEITETVTQQQVLETPASPFTVFRDLAVDPLKDKLYWTTGTQLLEASLTADNIHIIKKAQCYTRYIGLAQDTLYFSQEHCSTEGIRSLELSSLQEEIIAEGRGYYNDVAAFEDTAYWTGFGRLSTAPTSGEGPVTELVENFNLGVAFFRGIRVVHPDLQPQQ